jgi:hypothetical protein
MPLAAALLCIVIGIADGDTLTARCEAPVTLLLTRMGFTGERQSALSLANAHR